MLTRAFEFFGKKEPNESESESGEKEHSEEESGEKLKKLRKYLKRLLRKEIEKICILKHEIEDSESSRVEIAIEQEEIEMASNDDFKIPRFSGSNYSIWKHRILLFLEFKECLEPATRDRINEEEAEWKKKDLRARNIIYCSVTDDQLEFVRGETTARAILKKFDQLYLRESTALQLNIRSKLNRLSLRDFDNASAFFCEFEKLINELKSAGANINEREKLDYLLKTLPESMFHVADIIDSQPEQERTCEFLKSKISMWESSRSDHGKGKHSAFNTEKKNGACHNCGKFGHYKRDCRNKWQAGNGSGRGGNHGGNHGGAPAQGGAHRQQQQPYQQTRGPARGSGRGGRRGSWRQRGGTAGHYSERDNDSSATFLAQVEGKRARAPESGNEPETAAYASEKCDIEWILDSGCSDHIINNDKFFDESFVLKNPIKVKVGDGSTLDGTKVGNVTTYFEINGKRMKINLINVYYVREMNKNLISFAKVTDRNKIVSIGSNAKIYNESGKLIGIAVKNNGLYKIQSYSSKSDSYVGSIEQMTQKEKFHRLLGHVNFQYLNKMCKEKLVDGLPENLEQIHLKCGTCLQNKMHNLRFENNRYRAQEILEIVHTDVNGPHTTTGYDGSKYFVTFIDDYSKCAVVYSIKSKNEVTKSFENFINLVENLTGKRIKKLRCDNGREFINNDMNKILHEKGIILDTCPPYTHQLNGTAERYNRSIMNSARCLLQESNLPRKYWPEVIKTAAYLRNRTIANTVENKTPFEILFNEKPNIKNLKVYGSKVFARVPEVKRGSKWDRKADVGILVGYERNGYRILVNNKIIKTRNVEIVENEENLVGFSDPEIDDSESENKFDENFENSEVENSEKDKVQREIVNNNRLNVPRDTRKLSNSSDRSDDLDYLDDESRRSKRDRKKPERYGNPIETKIAYVHVVSAKNPLTYAEAVNSDESKL